MNAITSTTALPQEMFSGEPPKEMAFIAASASVDTTLLREMLVRHGIASFTTDEVILPGRTLAEVIRECIARADLVIAVLDDIQAGNVLFELGFAQALEKRILILVARDDLMPMVASVGAPYLRTTPDNPEAIEFGLAQILKAPHHGTRIWDEQPEQTKPLGNSADQLLGKLRSNLGTQPGNTLEQIIVEALQRSGVTVVSKAVEQDEATVIGVWSDDLEPWIANPLLIEVNLRFPQGEHLKNLENNLLRSMGGGKPPWALLIYKDANGTSNPDKELRGSRLLSIPAEEFLESLKRTSFGELVRHLRNARLNGRG